MNFTWLKVAALSFLLFACKKDVALLSPQNLENGKIGAFGHGGMGISSLLPMDSKASLLKAIQIGDGTEMDVQLSKDSVLFLYHSEALSEGTHCEGRISELNAAEIKCKYKSLVHPNFPLCTLEEFLEAIKSDSISILTFECKSYALLPEHYATYLRALDRLIVNYHLQGRVLLESILPDFLELAKTKLQGVKLFLYAEDVEWAIEKAASLQIYGVTFDMRRVDATSVKKAHEKGLRVTLFNQQSEQENLEAVALHPDFMQTDKLKHLMQVLH